MIHRKCGPYGPGTTCFDHAKKRCKFRYPKPFTSETKCSSDGYPLYARPNNSRSYNYKWWTSNIDGTRTKKEYSVDNRWVVPYNPYLSFKFNCHLNVELTTGISAVKYLYKYIFKGNDRATISLLNEDGIHEGKRYVDSRIITSTEAA